MHTPGEFVATCNNPICAGNIPGSVVHEQHNQIRWCRFGTQMKYKIHFGFFDCQPLEKIIALNPVRKFFPFEIIYFIQPAEFIHQDKVFISFFIQISGKTAPDETRCSCNTIVDDFVMLQQLTPSLFLWLFHIHISIRGYRPSSLSTCIWDEVTSPNFSSEIPCMAFLMASVFSFFTDTTTRL